MSANAYSTMVGRLATELLAGLSTTYAGLAVFKMHFRPVNIPEFTTYAIIVSPSSRPWEERVVGVRNIQYTLRADIYLLVKNYSETDSLFGTASPNFGLFQMVEDVKNLLRLSDLSGSLDKTYAEPGGDAAHGGGGPIEFEDSASGGFDTGGKSLIRRAKISFVGRMQPFCHPKV